MMTRWLVAVLFLVLSSSISTAHKSSDSYLSITGNDTGAFQVQWDIALRDLDLAIGLDGDGDGDLTWGEVRRRESAISAYATSRLSIEAEGRACALRPVATLIDDHSDGAYAVLQLSAMCPIPAEHLTIDYRLLFDLDSQHRGIFSLTTGERTATFAFGPDRQRADFALSPASMVGYGFGPQSVLSFFADGMVHMLGGYDHGLFLLMLLLPALTGRHRPDPDKPGSYSVTLIDITKILTAFTVGHAVSLSAAALGYVDAPGQLVEIAIAISIALAAFDNIRPIFCDRRWLVALAFGLIHGLGFANALGPLDLSAGALVWALLAFNLGLETAQIMIAAVLLPLSWLFADRQAAAQLGLQGCSIAAITVSIALATDRAFDLQMMPF